MSFERLNAVQAEGVEFMWSLCGIQILSEKYSLLKIYTGDTSGFGCDCLSTSTTIPIAAGEKLPVFIAM